MSIRQKHDQQKPPLPSLPPAGAPVLLRISVPADRSAARRLARTALREILAAWSGLDPAALPLEESPHGPVWRGQLGGQSLGISLSYAGGAVWIALRRGGRIGIDATPIHPMAEAEAVARIYLGPATLATIRAAPNPDRAFASAWTEREARLKCLGLELVEWTPERAQAEAICRCSPIDAGPTLAVTVALAP